MGASDQRNEAEHFLLQGGRHMRKPRTALGGGTESDVVRSVWRNERRAPRPPFNSLNRIGEPGTKHAMIEMGLRLGREPPNYLVHVAARLLDHAIEIGRQIAGVQDQKLFAALALFLRRPVVEKFGDLVERDPTRAYQLLAGEPALRLEHEKIIGVLDEIPLRASARRRGYTRSPRPGSAPSARVRALLRRAPPATDIR